MEHTEYNKHFHGWRLTRRETKAVKNLLRATGNAGAAEKLLRHSIAYGHSRLVVRRYLLARALGLTGLDVYERYFIAATTELTEDELDKAQQDVARRAGALLDREGASLKGAAGLVPSIRQASTCDLSEYGDTNLLSS